MKMKNSKLIEFWEIASKEFGIKVIFPFFTTLSNGVKIKAKIFIQDVGAEKGMLVFEEYEDVKANQQVLINDGFGYTIMDEPLEIEEYSSEDYLEMLEDWGFIKK